MGISGLTPTTTPCSMSEMTQTVLSGCSYPDSTTHNIRDEIEATITSLKVVIEQEASLHKALQALFVKRKEEAIAKVKEANLHLYSVNEEEVVFIGDLCRAAAAAHEELKSPMSPVNVNANAEGRPKDATSTRANQAEGTKDYYWTPFFYSKAGFLHRLTPAPNPISKVAKPSPLFKDVEETPLAMEPKFKDNLPPGSPLESIRVLSQDDALRRPATPGSEPDYSIIAGTPPRPTPKFSGQTPQSRSKSSSTLDPPRSPAHPTNELGAEPGQSPARLTHGIFNDPTKSPAKSTHEVFDKPPRSPANSIRAFELLRSTARSAHEIDATRFPVQYVHGIDDSLMSISPAQSNRGLSDDVAPYSSARPSRGPYKEENMDEEARRAQQTLLHSIGGEPKKAAETKKKGNGKKGNGKKGTANGIETKPTPSIISPTMENPPNLYANEEWPKSSYADDEVAAEENNFFATAVSKSKKGTLKRKIGGKVATKNTTKLLDDEPEGDAFRSEFGTNPITNTRFTFGAGSEPPSSTINFGAAPLENIRFAYGSASQTSPVGKLLDVDIQERDDWGFKAAQANDFDTDLDGAIINAYPKKSIKVRGGIKRKCE